MIPRYSRLAFALAPILLGAMASPARDTRIGLAHGHEELAHGNDPMAEWRLKEDCGGCHRWSYLPTSPWEKHYLTGGGDDEGNPVEPVDEGPESAWYYAGLFDCVAFNSCHSNEQSGDCYQYHYSCGEHVASAARLLDVALHNRSRAQFASLLSGYGKAVRVVADRQVVQIVDCAGTVVAQEPLPQFARVGH